jgi:hypothetical protein
MFRCRYEETCSYRADAWTTVAEHVEIQHGLPDPTAAQQYVRVMPAALHPWVQQWQAVAMAGFRLAHPVPAVEPAWSCAHCQASLTLRTCLYTPNRVGPEGQAEQPGDLCCPHCGISTLQAYTDGARVLVMAENEGQLAEDEDEDDTGEP